VATDQRRELPPEERVMANHPEPPQNSDTPTTVTHYKHTEDPDTQAVAVSSLRVLLVEDEDGWFAQGLELDYAAAGHDLEDVKRRFEEGLAATFNEHLNLYGTVENFLKIAPQDAWDLWLNADRQYSFAGASFHHPADITETEAPRLPFSGITYLQP